MNQHPGTKLQNKCALLTAFPFWESGSAWINALLVYLAFTTNLERKKAYQYNYNFRTACDVSNLFQVQLIRILISYTKLFKEL